MAAATSSRVRPSAIAGTWYPGTASELRRLIEDYLGQVQPKVLPGPVLALVSPHAGYAYSGTTAAHAFAQVRKSDFHRVVLLGPLHRPIWGSKLGSFMVPVEAAYHTPLGDIPLDRPFLEALGRRVALTPVRGDEEHSLEIELPFLQTALGSFSVVPLMMGEHVSEPGALERVEALSRALAELSDQNTLLVASTDLSHLHDHADVILTDRRLVDLVAAFDVDGLTVALQKEQVQACGAPGLVAILRAAQLLGAKGAQVLAYTTSGDITGDRRPGTYTVGYLAAAVHG